MKFRLEIVTPEKLAYSDEIDLLTIPTIQGEISILAHHVPLVTVIQPGEIRIRKETEVSYMAIVGGFVQVTGSKVTILADATERAEEIDLARAETARQRAQKLLSEKQADVVSHAEAMAALQRALVRIKVARRKGSRLDSSPP